MGNSWLIESSARATQYSQDAKDLVHLIFDTVDDFCKGHQTDDATLAVVRTGSRVL
jgi:hypothetical protein